MRRTRPLALAAALAAVALAGCGSSAQAPDQSTAATNCLRNTLYQQVVQGAGGNCTDQTSGPGWQNIVRIDATCTHKIANEYACAATSTCLMLSSSASCPTGTHSYDVIYDGRTMTYQPTGG